MKRLLQIIFLILSELIFSQNISGNVMSENEVMIPKVLIVNMTTNQKTYSDSYGKFIIDANIGDEIRFAKESYKLGKIVITSNQFQSVKLEKIPQEIEEVKIINKRLAESQEEELRKSIGLPKGPEKTREKPADAVDDIVKPLIGIPPTLNFQAIYDVVSGKSRRLRRLYKYEDLQEGLTWIKNNVDWEYFRDAGIEPQKMNDFLMFALRDEKVLMYMKAKNIGGLTIALDNNIGAYLERITQSK
ncbi:hypothetical protein [Epilithonimonas hungarica]|uniref:CarboxypepD_reg-like domain-containing protein n=1 Tax=Epilithonimonas hungarica TaxID=454006 RepID=A0A1G7HDQ1_9FLAO|nr:hypothetical protein [Epilithonimonas hungarica]SDE98443.1 hypothetical protein SAMN05421825_0763 [Epilithonimonas hungarica]